MQVKSSTGRRPSCCLGRADSAWCWCPLPTHRGGGHMRQQGRSAEHHAKSRCDLLKTVASLKLPWLVPGYVSSSKALGTHSLPSSPLRCRQHVCFTQLCLYPIVPLLLAAPVRSFCNPSRNCCLYLHMGGLKHLKIAHPCFNK